MRIFLSAGEASGDAYGAALVREIRRICRDQDWTEHNLRAFLKIRADVRSDTPFVALDSATQKLIREGVWELADFDSIGQGQYEFGALKLGDLLQMLSSEIKELHPEDQRKWSDQFSFEGIGGPKLKAEGVHLYADSSHWGAISIVQAVKVGFGVYYRMHRIKKYLRRGTPGLLIAIDFGFANIRLCRYAKKCGWKVLYFVPPGSWRRDRQGKDLPEIADEIVTPFEWSASILRGMGASAHWFGHPIKQLIQAQAASVERQATVAVLPGSRKHELEMNLPIIVEAAHGLDAQVEFALAPTVDVDDFRREWNRLAPGRDDAFTVGDTYSVLRRARAAIVCSGTATLEAALCRCPMVVMYQLSPGMAREAKLVMRQAPKFISLPNILMDREVVPELVGVDRIDPATLRAWLDKLLVEGDERHRQLNDFEELDEILGPSDAITKTAELAIRMAAS
jgi:lipid-A-disaccharide synthase